MTKTGVEPGPSRLRSASKPRSYLFVTYRVNFNNEEYGSRDRNIDVKYVKTINELQF